MVEANESGMSQWLGGKEKEEGKDGLIGMEVDRIGLRGHIKWVISPDLIH